MPLIHSFINSPDTAINPVSIANPALIEPAAGATAAENSWHIDIAAQYDDLSVLNVKYKIFKYFQNIQSIGGTNISFG